MRAVILDVGNPPRCAPLTATRPLADCLVGGMQLKRALELELVRHDFEVSFQGGGDPGGKGMVGRNESEGELVLYIPVNSWLGDDALDQLGRREEGCIVQGESGEVLAATSPSLPASENLEILIKPASFRIQYAWDLLEVNARILSRLAENDIRGQLSDRVQVEGYLVVGEGSHVLPGTYVEGNVVIGKKCKIGPNCYLRGPTSIGNGCHVGQSVEVKASILMDRVSVGHLTYLGDSILGEGTNLGAGTITANLRHDGGNHRSMMNGVLVDTGRRKFGVIMGDNVHTGIHTTLYPGRKLWPHTSTRPGEIVQRDIES